MQFLTLPDGLIPPGALVPVGARLTRPTAPPVAPAFHVMLDLGDGEEIGGVWCQRWTAVPTPVVVPASVTPLQARRALRAVGMMAAVDAFLGTANADTREAWEYASSVDRHEPMLTEIAAALGVTDEQLDSLFILAATL